MLSMRFALTSGVAGGSGLAGRRQLGSGRRVILGLTGSGPDLFGAGGR